MLNRLLALYLPRYDEWVWRENPEGHKKTYEEEYRELFGKPLDKPVSYTHLTLPTTPYV